MGNQRRVHQILFALSLVLFGVMPALAALPRNFKDFEKRYLIEGMSPEGATKLFFDALFVYMNESTRQEGRKMAAFSMKERPDWDRRPTMRLFAERLSREESHHIFRSYAKGATPDNGYAMDVNAYEITIERIVEGHPMGLQIYLRSGGADYPRVIYLRQFGSFWHVIDSNSVKVQVRPPRR